MVVSHAAYRPPAVAGAFYPGQPALLAEEVDRYLAQVAAETGPAAPAPKALIVPHAGYVYSGPIAATAFARLAAARERIRHVVLFGPAHRHWVAGMAVPSARAFRTPLGPVPLDLDAIARLTALPFVEVSDDAHAQEHSLEVQLPFLQRVLTQFTLTPVVIGGADGSQVATALDTVWGGDDTLVVISSDLSHYHDYDSARTRDRATCTAIEALRTGALTPEDACGCRGVDGLLYAAQRRALQPQTLDLRNSGDTAGPRDRVVGYGAWAFGPAAQGAGEDLDEATRTTLLRIAGLAVRAAAHGEPVPVINLVGPAPALRGQGAAFVTVQVGGELRGCLGSLVAHRPLAEDVAAHAHGAASTDPRFAPVAPAELDAVALEVAVLGAPRAMTFTDEADLLAQLRPGIDGVILQAGRHRGTFLPKVWDSLPEPAAFLEQLKRKAGLAPDYWSADVQVARYTTQSFAAPLNQLLT